MAAYLFPYFYCVLIGCVWSRAFHKKFRDSLAPAILFQIIIILIFGLTVQRLSLGLYSDILICIILAIIFFHKDAINEKPGTVLANGLKDVWNNGGLIFTIFYVFCIITDYGKMFYSWDEFSHWGMFLKECLRTNRLYCTSPLPFGHKDYVPAVTLFEFAWIKLCRRYHESDVYRSIQVMMFSLILPIFGNFENYALEYCKNKAKNIQNSMIAHLPEFFGWVLSIILFPLIFNTSNAFFFYHSIYCDFAVGVLTFYALYETYREYNRFSYQVITVTLALTGLVLAKMTSMALFPMIFVLFAVKQIWFSENPVRGKQLLFNLAPLSIPTGLWYIFNRFVHKYIIDTSGIQSYGNMKLSSVKDVFGNATNSSIPYLEDVRRLFINALFSRDILIHGSYAVVLACVVVIILVMGHLSHGLEKRKIVLMAFWTLAAGVAYAFLMYYLYETQFVEREARVLASYERYMNSFIAAIILMAIAIYFISDIWKRYMKDYCIILAILAFDLTFLHIDTFSQIVPGNLMHDEEQVKLPSEGAERIAAHTSNDSSVFVLKRGDNGDFLVKVRYYCDPRLITGYSVGPAAYDGDVFSWDTTVEQFVTDVSKCDYFYIESLDSAFFEKYAEGIADPSILTNKMLYHVDDITNGQLKLSYAFQETGSLKDIYVFEDYLEALKNCDYDVFISINDEGTRYMTDKRQILLSDLGVKTDLRGKNRMSYLAVIENGSVTAEECSEDTIEYSGTLTDTGVLYSVKSGGYKASSMISSIMINGKEYSLNRRGLNFVVYDPFSNEVVDSTTFDLFDGGICYR